MRRWLHGRSYQQMIVDGDLPEDRGERLIVIMGESFIRGFEQSLIAIFLGLCLIGLIWAIWHYHLIW